jgi:hypothetical protein
MPYGRCLPLVLLVLAASPARGADPSRLLVRFEMKGTKVEGTPLATAGNQVVLIDRDGRLWDFDSRQAAGIQKTTTTFRAHTAATMRARLAEEFGRRFEVSGTGRYLVVHPKGERDLWSRRFEELYRSFVHYWSVRGVKVQAPEFPLVAVVFPAREDFHRYALAEGTNLGSNVLGYYWPVSNRVALYDQTAGQGSEADWGENAATIIHEATHQTAFNCGLHNRFTAPPRWVAEGLGTLFEAPGVWDSRDNPRKQDRINAGRMRDFRAGAAARKEGRLAEMISSDRFFDTDPAAAYAEAWAFTWFLSETRPREYTKYLVRTAARPAFREYTSAERMADFTAVFGQNLRLLEASFVRFMAEAPR